YIYALQFGITRGVAGEREGQPSDDHRAAARNLLRPWPRSGELLLVCGDSVLSARIPAGLHLLRSAHGKHERRHEGYDEYDVQDPESRFFESTGDSDVYVECGE